MQSSAKYRPWLFATFFLLLLVISHSFCGYSCSGRFVFCCHRRRSHSDPLTLYIRNKNSTKSNINWVMWWLRCGHKYARGTNKTNLFAFSYTRSSPIDRMKINAIRMVCVAESTMPTAMKQRITEQKHPSTQNIYTQYLQFAHIQKPWDESVLKASSNGEYFRNFASICITQEMDWWIRSTWE